MARWAFSQSGEHAPGADPHSTSSTSGILDERRPSIESLESEGPPLDLGLELSLDAIAHVHGGLLKVSPPPAHTPELSRSYFSRVVADGGLSASPPSGVANGSRRVSTASLLGPHPVEFLRTPQSKILAAQDAFSGVGSGALDELSPVSAASVHSYFPSFISHPSTSPQSPLVETSPLPHVHGPHDASMLLPWSPSSATSVAMSACRSSRQSGRKPFTPIQNRQTLFEASPRTAGRLSSSGRATKRVRSHAPPPAFHAPPAFELQAHHHGHKPQPHVGPQPPANTAKHPLRPRQHAHITPLQGNQSSASAMDVDTP